MSLLSSCHRASCTVHFRGKYSFMGMSHVPGSNPHSIDQSYSTLTTSDPKPKRPSPYRLLTPTSFLASFAGLHVSGWRLVSLPHLSPSVNGDIRHDNGDLQDRRLIRIYEFGGGRQGWRELMDFSSKVMKQVEDQDHHPVITILPASDHTPIDELPLSAETGYILHLSTHTHTPLPPIGTPKDAGKMRPGVTQKDLNLAESLEAVYNE